MRILLALVLLGAACERSATARSPERAAQPEPNEAESRATAPSAGNAAPPSPGGSSDAGTAEPSGGVASSASTMDRCIVVGAGPTTVDGVLRAGAGGLFTLKLARPRCVVGLPRASFVTEVAVATAAADLRPLVDAHVRLRGTILAGENDLGGPAVVLLARDVERIVPAADEP